MPLKGYKQTEEHKRKLCKFLQEEELQFCEDYKLGKSLNELAKKCGCSIVTIWHILIRNNIKIRHAGSDKGEKHPRFGKGLSGEKNGMYGVHRFGKDAPNFGTHHSPETKQKIREKTSTPEAIQQSLKNGYGTKCCYKGEFFPSKFEKDGCIKLIKLGFEVIHNFLGRFDAKAKKGNFEVVIEFHMFNSGKGKDRIGLTYRQYYYQRRKLLNEYEYKDLKLVIIKDLKEIENKFS